MNKQCKKCGAVVPSEVNFCHMCGGSDFVALNQQPQSGENYSGQADGNQNQYGQPNLINRECNSQVPQQPKKKKTGLIIGIVAAALIVLVGIGILVGKFFQNQEYTDTDDTGYYDLNTGDTEISSCDESNRDETEETNKVEAEYTKGTFDGSVYTNEWADIEFALPEGFSNADSDMYSTAENSVTECGAYFISNEAASLIYICYEKLPAFPLYDEEKYLDSAMKSFESVSGITYNLPDAYSEIIIGGYTYLKAECELNNGYETYANTICVRKLDNYIIFISALSINAESNAALISNIAPID